MQRNVATEETVKAVIPPVTTARSTTPFAASPLEEWVQSASTQTQTCMYCWQRGHWMMWCAERLANEARTMSGVSGGYRNESTSESPKIERTGAGTDQVRATGPECSRGKKLISFGNLFWLQDIYEDDEGVRIHDVESQAEISGSVEVTVKNWQYQVAGVSDKRRIRIKKLLHFE